MRISDWSSDVCSSDLLGFSKRATPTQTLGTSRDTAGRASSAEGAGTFDEPDRLVNLIGPRRFDEYNRLCREISIIGAGRSEEPTSEHQSLMRLSYAVFC